MSLRLCMTCVEPLAAGERFCARCGTPVEGRAAAGHAQRVAHYRLEQKIAEGGMGVVYRAFDERLSRSVAVKLLRSEYAQDEEFRRRFNHEWRGAASLEHQNILPVFDAGDHDGTLYIATRLVQGVDLRHLVEREGPLAPARALDLAGQVAAALDYAHSHGIVHRDVKPANVLVVPAARGEAEHAYLIDFGIIKVAGGDAGVTATGRFVGTPDYAAPEQILGEQVTARADQYSLACLLFHCLTGHAPFADTSANAVLQSHLHAEPPHVAAHRPGLEPALDAALRRGMDKNPYSRFETCAVMVNAARQTSTSTVFEGVRPAAEPIALLPREPEAKRRRWVPALAAVAGLLAITGGVAAAVRGGGSDGPKPVASPTTTATPRPTSTPQPTPTPTATPRPPRPPVRFDVADLSFREHALEGYAAALPSGWRIAEDVESEEGSGARRRKTTAKDPDREVSLLIDHVTGSEADPEQWRSAAEAQYAAEVDGYGFRSEDDFVLDGRAVSEWRYHLDARGRRRVRRVHMFFKDGAHSFAVVASGPATYDSLAGLAEHVVGSVRVQRDPRLPDDGLYEGQAHVPGGEDEEPVEIHVTLGERSTIDYLEQDCAAQLARKGFAGRAARYVERSASPNCDDTGVWTFERISEKEVRARRESEDGSVTLVAALRR